MGRRRSWPHHPAAPVAVLALAAAVAALVVKSRFFPYLSINNDEAINAFFADTLARGRLFAPTAGEPDAFRPWLAAVSGDHYVLKYAPVVPAMVAASLLLTGGPGLYLGLLAAASVVVTYLLAGEVLQDRAEALVATVLVALSPLVVVHSALLLSYLPTLVLFQAFAWALLRGRSAGRPALFGLSGLALGLAFFIRPFDAVVFAAPLLAWAVLQWRRGRGGSSGPAWFVAAGAVPLAGFAAFNAAATGSPLRLSFSLLEPADTLGFGPRRFYPTDTMRQFGPAEGLEGVVRHGLLLGWWVAGGAVLVALAAATVARRRITGPAWALVLGGALLPLAYTFFWGPWNATVLWGGTTYVGPFYFLPVLVPLGLCGARGLADLYRWRPAAGVAAALGIAAATTATLAWVLAANGEFTDDNRALHDLVADGGGNGRKLVFVSPHDPFLMHPSSVVSNRSDLSGPVVYAVEGGAADLDLARRHADRTPYRLRFDGDFTDHTQRLRGRLDRMGVVAGDELAVQLVVRAPKRARSVLEVTAFGTRTEYALSPGATTQPRLLVSRRGARLEGGMTSPLPTVASSSGEARVRVLVWPRAGKTGPPWVAATERLPLRPAEGALERLAPVGPAWTTGPASRAVLEVTA